MFRPPNANKPSTLQKPSFANTTDNSSPTTIREIKSKAVTTSNARSLLVGRRQALSMERLDSQSTSQMNQNERAKNSPPSCGSSTSGSTAASPVRSGGLNRTASRVSRFRTAKAVFERLSSTSNTAHPIRPEKPQAPEKSRTIIASRYASAARPAISNAGASPSPRSRFTTPTTTTASASLAKSRESDRSSSNSDLSKVTSVASTSPAKNLLNQPKPQPRVMTNRLPITSTPANSTLGSGARKTRPPVTSSSSTAARPPSQAKPPPKDLIDKIVLEIARDATEHPPDPDCTIQDLSNCDISNIPDTIDFDICFQDVEMMTEEEARKLLSRKSESPPILESPTSTMHDLEPTAVNIDTNQIEELTIDDPSAQTDPKETIRDQQEAPAPPSVVVKNKVRFSEEPVQVYNTHAVDDYDRRNNDIDPVAASAEYELEKAREREGLVCSDDDDEKEQPSHITPKDTSREEISILDDAESSSVPKSNSNDDDELAKCKDYINSLEREVGLKRILEQNLRDLQSQYYEAVRQLDDYRATNDQKLAEYEESKVTLTNQLSSLQSDLNDKREHSIQLQKELTENKESSQLLEKKYHRAKKIIKDMQSREQSFTRREQLYQQKLDEIEYEFGALIESIDRTILNDGMKFFNLLDQGSCQWQHQTRLDVFGLLRHILANFSGQSTQNPQIKQRVVTILEQQLANIMLSTNGVTSTTGSLNATKTSGDNVNSLSADGIKSNQNVSHSISSQQMNNQPLSAPHPIGVGGQPLKMFHGIPSSIPKTTAQAQEKNPSPPHSVNSYPSSNSLNSLNNNNNNNNNATTTNHNAPLTAKIRDHKNDAHSDIGASKNLSIDDKFHAPADIQVPFHTGEWHEKPVSEWTTTQVSTWLLALGLDQYITKFEDRNVNGQSLINLDSTVLKGLGVLNSNDRNLLKKKIRELRAELEKERKLSEKKLKETLKDRSKSKVNNGDKHNGKTDGIQNKPSWKRGLLS